MVTHMEDCVTLWVQSIKGEQGHEMYELEAQLLSFCETSQPITSKPTFNMVIISVVFTYDFLYSVRAELILITGPVYLLMESLHSFLSNL